MNLPRIKPRKYFLLLTLPLFFTCTQVEPYRNPKLSVDERVDDLIGRMTLEEKISQLVEDADSIPRLGIPRYNWWSEGLHGVARAGVATVFPQAIGLAATFNDSMMHEVATVISDEFRAKYNHFQSVGERDRYKGLTVWSPNINIFRDPRWGRGQETYGEDPYLTARMGVAFVKGLQGDNQEYYKTIATPKHYVVHSGPESLRHEFDVEISQRDFMDTYLPAFEACVVEGGAGSVMGAYNRFRGKSCSGSKYLLTDILRDKWGFDGYVVSDCGAIYDIFGNHQLVASEAEAAAIGIKAGCDLNCGRAYHHLDEAVEKGYCTEEDLDVALKRLFKARIKLGMFDPPEIVPFNKIPVEVNDCPAHKKLALEAAREAMVLLKNEKGFLPLSKDIGKVAVIGPNANNEWVMYGNYNGVPSKAVTVFQGIKDKLGSEADVHYAQGCSYHEDYIEKEVIPWNYLSANGKAGLSGEYFNNPDLEGQPYVVRQDSTLGFFIFNEAPVAGMNKEHYSARWSGELTIPRTGEYTLYLSGDDGFRLFLDGKKVIDAWEDGWKRTNLDFSFEEGSVHTIRVEYYQNDWASGLFLEWGLPAENIEKEALELAKEADLILFVGGLSYQLEGEEMEVKLSGFAGGDRTRITLPRSQEEMLKKLVATGNPVVLVLMNGSALAVNWADEHVPAILEAWYPGQSGGTAIADILFGDYNPAGRLPVTFYRSVEQLPPFTDYDMQERTYRYFTGDPLYEFGFGLSYTSFQYSNLKVTKGSTTGDDLEIEVDIENTGDRDGDEVVQVYLRHNNAGVPVPLQGLKAFRRIHLKKGEKKRVGFTIPNKELIVISDANERVVMPGGLTLFVGGSQPDDERIAEGTVLAHTIKLTGSPNVIDKLEP